MENVGNSLSNIPRDECKSVLGVLVAPLDGLRGTSETKKTVRFSRDGQREKPNAFNSP